MPINWDNDGSAIQPTFAWTSERSLGLYRSGTSVMALSYGTLSVPVLSGTIAVTAATISDPNPACIFNVSGAGSGSIQFQEAGVYKTSGMVWNATTHTLHFDDNATGAIFDGALSATKITTSGITANLSSVSSAGQAVSPAFHFGSEVSLGWYRSAASTMALSYGTIDLTGGGAMTSIASLKIKAGANNSCGTAVLGSNGSVNVANTYVKTGDLIFLTDQTPGGTLGDLEMTGIRNSSGFTIASTSVTDTSTVAWLIIRPG